MYDKGKIRIDRAYMQGATPQQVAACLTEAKEQVNLKTGEMSIHGHIEGMKVAIYESGVLIIGSLAKFLYGNNIYPLDKHSIKEAITKLEDALHMHLDEARVIGFEFGTTFVMQHPVGGYLDMLGDYPRLDRCRLTPTSIYYRPKGKRKPKEICFYDKGAEEKQKGLILPNGFEGLNLLRYEIRFHEGLSRQVGYSNITLPTLATREFYKHMVGMYQETYNRIHKLNQIKPDAMTKIKTVKDAIDVFTAKQIKQGGQEQVTNYIEELKRAKVFNDRKYYTRLKNGFNAIMAKADITATDELIKELDREILNVGVYE